MAKAEKTSKAVASKASKLLKNSKTPASVKSVAASALTQAADKKSAKSAAPVKAKTPTKATAPKAPAKAKAPTKATAPASAKALQPPPRRRHLQNPKSKFVNQLNMVKNSEAIFVRWSVGVEQKRKWSGYVRILIGATLRRACRRASLQSSRLCPALD